MSERETTMAHALELMRDPAMLERAATAIGLDLEEAQVDAAILEALEAEAGVAFLLGLFIGVNQATENVPIILLRSGDSPTRGRVRPRGRRR